MQPINTLSVAPDARAWLANSRHPRILHIFDHACNLINERREVLSVVTPQIGNGPFNLVIEEDVLFPKDLNTKSSVSILEGQLQMGDLIITMRGTKLWNPRPDWEKLHSQKEIILPRLTQLPMITKDPMETNYFSPNPQFCGPLISALAWADLPASLAAAQKLAGLGQGLTPSGDDFTMGALYAAWIIHPSEIAVVLATEIASTAAPLTTSLSAAWIRSAGRGEAGILWHELFDALIVGNDIQPPITKLLSVGETSGADALTGSVSTSVCWMGTQELHQAKNSHASIWKDI